MSTGESKACTKCGEVKLLEEFNSDKSRPSGKHPWCKSCARAARNAWYEKNRDTNLAYQAQWREANPEAKRESNRTWREANVDRKRANDRAYREAHLEHLTAYIREYHQANKAKWLDYRRDRRARLRDAFVAIVRFDEILLRDLGVCGICAKPIMEATVELDHIIPVAAGGTHEPDNIQLAHRSCNRRKSAKVGFTLVDAAA